MNDLLNSLNQEMAAIVDGVRPSLVQLVNGRSQAQAQSGTKTG